MTRTLKAVSVVAAGVWVAVMPARAQSKSVTFDDLFRLVQKCDVDSLKATILSYPGLNLWDLRDANGSPLVVRTAETGCVEAEKTLVVHAGADLSATDRLGRTALHAAAEMSTQSMVQLLVDAKAEINAKTAAGDTPLSLAKKNNYKGKTEQRDKIVAYLTKKGAKN